LKKRVAISRALASEPEYIFFDEPTTGLDPVGVFNICHLIRRLQDEGKTTLMVTHDLHTAFAVSERFSFIYAQRIIFDGTREEMMLSESSAIREFLKPSESSLFVLPNKPSGGSSMKRSDNIAWSQIKVGIFIICALICLAGGDYSHG
jgi:phospholipid/cholesterol/gamma-HCH transport system ATP-binding protein